MKKAMVYILATLSCILIYIIAIIITSYIGIAQLGVIPALIILGLMGFVWKKIVELLGKKGRDDENIKKQ